MNISVVNYCKKKLKFDVEKIVRGILKKIPAKYLTGISEICIFDHRTRKNIPSVRYLMKKKNSKTSKIEIYMDDPDFSGSLIMATLSFNTLFILAINEHIEKFLKKRTKDKEILIYPPSMANHNWMYFGKWDIMLKSIKVVHYIIFRINFLKKLTLLFTKKFISIFVLRKH